MISVVHLSYSAGVAVSQVERVMRISSRTLLTICLAVAAAGLTSCSAPVQDEFSFVQMCDTQLGYGGYDHDVRTFRSAVKQINALKPDFVVICGDLINRTGDDKAFADFSAVKAGFKMPCHCVAGNHDVGNSPTVKLLKRYRKLVGKDYYSFEHKGNVFVVVNTQLWKVPVAGESAKHNAWFEKTLKDASPKGAPVFVVGHYPLYLRELDEAEVYGNLPIKKRKELLALFDKHGVAAMLSGHAHRNVAHEHNGVQLVISASTSRNVDGAPMGFRVWRIGKKRPYQHEYVPVKGARPPGESEDP